MISKHLRIAVVILAMLTAITGVIYPFLVTAIAQIAFPDQANGSIAVRDGRATGSTLIGQPFTSPGYFWSRPSATGPFPYNAGASSGSNLGPLNPALPDRVKQDLGRLKAADSTLIGPVPIDLVTTSGSGLDPHISPDAARIQIPRVARARGLAEARVSEFVERHTEGRFLGIFGEPRVNVLVLNLALDASTTSKGAQ
jgi:potassium-transporting ATPase KdpC subunit